MGLFQAEQSTLRHLGMVLAAAQDQRRYPATDPCLLTPPCSCCKDFQCGKQHASCGRVLGTVFSGVLSRIHEKARRSQKKQLKPRNTSANQSVAHNWVCRNLS